MRTSKEGLEATLAALKGEVERIRRRRAEFAGVAERELAVKKELAEVEAQLAEHGRPTPRPEIDLDSVRIATPCNADWAEMSGDDRSRFCGKCEKNVYNLSAMTREEARDLILEKEGRVCVRFFVREDGTMLTQDCPVGVRKKRVRLALYGAIGSSAMAVAGLAGATVVVSATPGSIEVNAPRGGHTQPTTTSAAHEGTVVTEESEELAVRPPRKVTRVKSKDPGGLEERRVLMGAMLAPADFERSTKKPDIL